MEAYAYILLGSNMGDSYRYIDAAIEKLSTLEKTKIIQQSSVIVTKPLEYTKQPDFVNTVVALLTQLPPHTLLEKLQKIEYSLGRERTIPKGPRTIDCDILLYDDMVCNTPELTLPHPQIYTRPFAAQLLLEINNDIIDPLSHKPLREVVLCHQ
ncbi:MAG TPA: 2-amino-4-hydroxy-6-hydroxymethyldihydropteridine diphosphokinase [Spirochaetota bacterium]|nr:2-amino-4-hydroxy-6-hydroxymethyldihydropteridine diphosphokinase [Spirochaetota bacterium]HOM11672.1 2-amino-4-hydroxy-6-hydroxymethyldihydropteridine diphosphokinase [Spirochaetota bacterium]